MPEIPQHTLTAREKSIQARAFGDGWTAGYEHGKSVRLDNPTEAQGTGTKPLKLATVALIIASAAALSEAIPLAWWYVSRWFS